MGFLEEERKRLLEGRNSGGVTNNGALSFLDRERERLKTGLPLSPDGEAKIAKRQAREEAVESKIPNIGDPSAALRNLPSQIQQLEPGPEPGANASQAEKDAWTTKKVQQDARNARAQQNRDAAEAAKPEAPKRYWGQGFNEFSSNLFGAITFGAGKKLDDLNNAGRSKLAEDLKKSDNPQYRQYGQDLADRSESYDYYTPKFRESGLGLATDIAGSLLPGQAAFDLAGLATKGIGNTLGRTLTRGALTGGGYQAGVEGVDAAFGGDSTAMQRAARIGISAGLGAGADAGLTFAGQALARRFPRLGGAADDAVPTTDVPQLPLGQRDARMAAAAQRGVNPPGTEPIVEPFQFGLPEGNPATLQRQANASGARKELDDVTRTISEWQNQFEQQVVREYQYLKSSLSERGGVQQGQVFRDQTGNVIGRSGRQSNNPEWYQDFYRSFGRTPSNKDLYALAQDRVKNGFRTETGPAPAWAEESGYNAAMQAYAPVRDSLAQSLKELDPRILRTDTPIVENRLQDTRLAGRPIPARQGVVEGVPAEQPTVPGMQPSRANVVDEAVPGISPAAAYEAALQSGDVAAMRAIDPDVANRMQAYTEAGGSIGELPAPLRARVLSSLGISEQAPANLARTAPTLPRVNEPVPQRVNEPTPTPALPRSLPEPNANTLTPDPNAQLGPDVNPSQGLGILPGRTFGTSPYTAPLNDTRSQLRSRADLDLRDLTDPGLYKAAGQRLYQNFVDDLAPVQRLIDKTIERVQGAPLTAAESPYKMALAGRGNDMVARQIVTEGMVNSRGEVIGKSLKDVLAPIRSQRENVDLEDYLVNRHAITRSGPDRGEKVFRDDLNWTPQVGADKVAAYEQKYPEFAKIADDLYTFQKQVVDNFLVDSGLISREAADAWVAQNPYYVPNKRYFSKLERTNRAGAGGGSGGVANTANPVKGYRKGDAIDKDIADLTPEDLASFTGGSERQIISPIEAIIENVDAYVKAGNRNRVMQQIYKAVATRPEDFAGIIRPVKKAGKELPEGDINELVRDLTIDFSKIKAKGNMDVDNIVRARINGETVPLEVQDLPLLEALTAMGPQGSAGLLDVVGAVTNFFKKYTTGSNPFFALTRNLPRDFVQGYVSSTTTNNPFRYFGDYLSSIADVVGGRPSYQAYKNIGGGHSSSVAADRNLLAQSKRQLVGAKTPLNGLKRGLDAYDNFLNAVESAPRLAEFKRIERAGGDIQEGLFKASDVTVNFKRRGRLARDIDKVFPYFNAAMQGLDQLGRLYANKATRPQAIAKGIVSLSVPTVLLYLMNRDNPDYQQLTERQKDNYFHVPKGDGTFWKIAKPRELGTIFSDGIERGMRALDGEGNEAFREFAEQIRVAFLPPGLSGLTKDTEGYDRFLGDTILAPFTQLGANKNFAGSPIVPGYLERLSPELQRDAKTSKLGEMLADAPLIGKIADNSPKKADFLIRAYTGWVGQFGTAATTPGTGLGKALEQQVSIDPLFSNDISTEFYEYKTKLDQAYADREYAPLPDWYNDNIRSALNDYSTRMSDIRKEVRAIQSDETISKEEKEQLLRERQQWINELAEEGNSIARGSIPRK